MYNPHHNEKNNVEAATILAVLKISHTWRPKINLLILLHSSFSSCNISKQLVLTADFLGDDSTLKHEYMRASVCLKV